ncbi:DNA-binding protein [Natrinema saccharevitans]|uniref:DNA-binding protein n=1 Tax=Natrinema saccharevitans TaxID=301967 RepID=A0A1S8ARX2_9EURY|nr:OB-fold domain-containing protein [Natrinema saccharevitans]OLZ39430.1 DNA-binding protein [Natrinema saccharevitans]
MSWDPRPTPDITPETERYWSAAADGELLVRECDECGLVYHYPRELCPDCFSDSVSWRETNGTGTVYSYSTARKMGGWPDEDLPLIVAYVELDEGPRVMTNLACEPDEIEIGTPVEVRFRAIEGADAAVPVFVPRRE